MRSQESQTSRPTILALPEVVGVSTAQHSRDRMEATCHIDALRPLSETLGRRVVGQSEAIEHELVDPLSRFIASQKLHAGDVVEVELEQEQLAFFRS